MFVSRIFPVIFLTFAVFYPASPDANTLNWGDCLSFDNFSRKAFSLLENTATSQRSVRSATIVKCLDQIKEVIMGPPEFAYMQDLVCISSQMRDQADESYVNHYISDDLDLFLLGIGWAESR
jgi:hypothetical protein